MNSFGKLSVALFAGVTILTAGCRDDVVNALPRKSTAQPVFGKGVTVEKNSNSTIDFSFLHQDHFGCLGLNVSQIISHPELASIDWGSLETQMVDWVGADNAKLDRIERIWVLIDRESLGQIMSGGGPQITTVIDYKTTPNLEQLNAAQAERNKASEVINNSTGDDRDESSNVIVEATDADGKTKDEVQDQDDQSTTDPALQFAAKSIGKNRIALGTAALINKINGTGTSSILSRQLSYFDFEADIEGLITMGPVRPTLKSLFGAISMLPQIGDQAKKLGDLPDQLQRIEFKLSLQDENILKAAVLIDDKEMVNQIMQFLQDSEGQPGTPIGMPGMMPWNARGGAPNTADLAGQSIIPLTAPDIIEEVAAQIQADNLFSTEGLEDRVTFTMKRPDKLKELIETTIQDGKRAAEFAKRAEQMERVASAMEAYYVKHQCFPPAGSVVDDKDGLPNQLNWRVGLLPFLGQQDLYDQFDFSKPWDDPKNMKVASEIPEDFAFSSFDPGNDETSLKTRFHLPGGKIGLFGDGTGTRQMGDIVDRKTWTAIVLEGAPSTEEVWTQPGILDLGDGDAKKLGSTDENGVLMINGSFKTRVIKREENNLKAVISFAGEERLTTKSFFKTPTN